jgi:hypothetical protein
MLCCAVASVAPDIYKEYSTYFFMGHGMHKEFCIILVIQKILTQAHST